MTYYTTKYTKLARHKTDEQIQSSFDWFSHLTNKLSCSLLCHSRHHVISSQGQAASEKWLLPRWLALQVLIRV